MTLWMEVSRDKYEHPIVIADSPQELAEKCGVKVHSIHSYMSHCRKTNAHCKYVKVEVEDECQDLF